MDGQIFNHLGSDLSECFLELSKTSEREREGRERGGEGPRPTLLYIAPDFLGF